MSRIIDRVGSRLLAMFVPKITAAACVFPDCHDEFVCNATNHLSRRRCCRTPECDLSCTPFSPIDVTC